MGHTPTQNPAMNTGGKEGTRVALWSTWTPLGLEGPLLGSEPADHGWEADYRSHFNLRVLETVF